MIRMGQTAKDKWHSAGHAIDRNITGWCSKKGSAMIRSTNHGENEVDGKICVFSLVVSDVL
jgi:hypothetical protein